MMAKIFKSIGEWSVLLGLIGGLFVFIWNTSDAVANSRRDIIELKRENVEIKSQINAYMQEDKEFKKEILKTLNEIDKRSELTNKDVQNIKEYMKK